MIAAFLFTIIVITTIPADIDAQTERNAVYLSLAIYIVPALIEGVFTAILATFLERVKPELLDR